MRPKTITIEEMHLLAAKRGGKCISTTYINQKIKLEWECSVGHKWWAAPEKIKYANTWCPDCGGRKKLSIDDMHEIAKANNGKCLSIVYQNIDSLLKWECAEGHQWEAIGDSVKNAKRWCPKCAGNAKHTIEEMHLYAEKNGGKCLSTFYTNKNTKLKWECSAGHIFMTTATIMLLKKSFCDDCSIIERFKYEINQIVASKNGKCLTFNFSRDNTQKINLECHLGHKWETTLVTLRGDCWCPECANCKKLEIDDYHNLAKTKNGICHINSLPKYKEKIKWECDKGHTWNARVDTIKVSWCPECSASVTENLCREVFEEIFQKPFPRSRYNWLKNDKTDKNLELDGYCAELNIAFEYQGIQHYEEVKAFKINDLRLKDIQYRDSLKINICKSLNIKLIVIPTITYRSKDNVRKIITELLNNYSNLE